MPGPSSVCECDHPSRDHTGGGRCGGLDSYGQPCGCPSFVEAADVDPDPVDDADADTALRFAGETGRAPARDNYDTNRH